jgi:SAM-dependent methyltransferase
MRVSFHSEQTDEETRGGHSPVLDGLIEIRHVQTPRCSALIYERLHARANLTRPAWFSPWLLAQCDLRPGMHLLDVACGAGQLANTARAAGLDVTAVDIARLALAGSSAESPPSGHFGFPVRADGQRLPFPDATFDIVVNIGSLEHFSDPLAGICEMARVLMPAGRAVLLLPNSFGWRGMVLHAWRTGEVIDDGQPIQRYGTVRQWGRLLESGGLGVERVLGCESLAPALPRRPRDGIVWLRHPSRWSIPLNRWLPVTMAAELVFVCSRADPST